MNLFTKQKQSYRCGKQSYGYQGGKGGGIDWEIGIDIYTLLCVKQVTNKDLLYSTGNTLTDLENDVMGTRGEGSQGEGQVGSLGLTCAHCYI